MEELASTGSSKIQAFLVYRCIDSHFSSARNLCRTWPISNQMKVMMWMCGLRGPIAYALCVNMPTKNSAIETTTLFIVVTTTLIFGIATGPMVKGLGLTPDLMTTENVPILGHRGRVEILEGRGRVRSTPHRLFKWIDKVYLKPIFGGRVDGDLYEPMNGDNHSTDGSDYERSHEGGTEGLSDDDESFKYPDVTLFEMPPPVYSRIRQHPSLDENRPLQSVKSEDIPLLQ